MNLFERIISLIAPHECLVCSAEGHLLCVACSDALPAAVLAHDIPGVDHVWPGVLYEGVAKTAVHTLKFERAAAAVTDIARSIAAPLPSNNAWIVTHVPTAATRVRQRGYDQSRLIARLVAARIAAPYMPLLARTTDARQVGASRMQRKQQMHTAFRPLQVRQFQKKYILLIDDVLTTGSTIEAAAAVLRTAGAARVSAAVFATAPSKASEKRLALL